MNVLVTGNYGYIGTYVSKRLFEGGHNIFGVDNLSTPVDKKYMDASIPCFFYENISYTLEKMLSERKFDAVIHLAASTSIADGEGAVHQYYLNNFYETVRVVNVVKKFKIPKFVFTSSAAVFSSNDSTYGLTKRMCEQYIEEELYCSCTETSVLRLFNVSGSLGGGPVKRSNFIGKAVRNLLLGLPLYIYFDSDMVNNHKCINYHAPARRTWIHVDDVAVAIRNILNNRAMQKHKISYYNLGIHYRSVLDVLDTISRTTDGISNNLINPRILPSNETLISRTDNADYLFPSNWKPIDFDDIVLSELVTARNEISEDFDKLGEVKPSVLNKIPDFLERQLRDLDLSRQWPAGLHQFGQSPSHEEDSKSERD